EAPFIKQTNAICKSHNKSWVVFHYCQLKAYARNKTSLNINVTFIHPAHNIHLKVKILKRANGYKPFLYDYTIDACQFMRKRNHPVTRIIWDMIKNVSTVNHTCPYVGLQALSDFYDVRIPLPLPTGDYLLILTFLFDGKPQFTTKNYFLFKEDF
ncbi:hypothetical protein KR084_010538, partial [Drosophila pseudotakahashii]